MFVLLLATSTSARADDAEVVECAVTWDKGMFSIGVNITGDESVLRKGLAPSRAFLDGDDVRMKGLFGPARVGALEGDHVVVGSGLFEKRSEPFEDGSVTVRRGLFTATYSFTTTCTPRQVALGVAHIERVRAARAQSAHAAAAR